MRYPDVAFDLGYSVKVETIVIPKRPLHKRGIRLNVLEQE